MGETGCGGEDGGIECRALSKTATQAASIASRARAHGYFGAASTHSDALSYEASLFTAGTNISPHTPTHLQVLLRLILL